MLSYIWVEEIHENATVPVTATPVLLLNVLQWSLARGSQRVGLLAINLVATINLILYSNSVQSFADYDIQPISACSTVVF